MEGIATYQTSLLQQYENAKIIEQNIQNLSSDYSSALLELKATRAHLCGHLTLSLSALTESRLCTLENLIDGKVALQLLEDKIIDQDFLYLYQDSTNRPRIIHPLQFTAYKINDKIAWDNGTNRDYTVYEEDELLEYLRDLTTTTKNWMVQFNSAELFKKLADMSVPIAQAFMFLDNTRKVHYSMKLDRVYLFREEDLPEETDFFMARNKLLEVNKYLLAQDSEAAEK